MLWNFGFGVNPNLTFFGEGSEKKVHSERITMSLSFEGTDNEVLSDGTPEVSYHRQMSAEDKRVVFIAVRSTMVNSRPKRGIFSELAKQLGFEPLTVSRQWHQMEKSLHTLLSNHPVEEHEVIIQRNHHILFGTKHFQRRQGKFKHDRTLIREKIRGIQLKSRRTRRQLAAQLDLPLSTTHWLVKDRANFQGPKLLYGGRVAKVHSSSLKPTLTNGNVVHRLLYALDQIKPGGLAMRVPAFQDQMDRVHLDEKWFWLCQDGEKYILLEDEPPPKRTTKHKNYIEKVMFLCAQARPRFDYTKNTMWDGKIGIWAIGHWEVAVRSSVNRPAGTPVWKNDSMDKKRYSEMMVDLVFPAILENWPVGELINPHFKIRIQQDNAPAHPKVNDAYINGELAKLWDPNEVGVLTPGKIELYAQPPNSPDTNILDLGFFNALQSAYWTHAPKNSGDIIKMVQQTYKDYPWQMIDRLFVTLQSIFDSIIVAHGSNHYTITHMNKAKMQRDGTLPRELALTQDAIETIDEWNSVNPPNQPHVAIAPPDVAPFPVAVVVVPGTDGDSCASFGSEGERIIEELVEERVAEEARVTDQILTALAEERALEDIQADTANNSDDDTTVSKYSFTSEEERMLAEVENEHFDLRVALQKRMHVKLT
jgi:hypothetical protein